MTKKGTKTPKSKKRGDDLKSLKPISTGTMRKVTANDLFGDFVNTQTNVHYTKKELHEPVIASFRKQGEYGERKRIKP